ncbi:hypothetical protein FAIPA1_40144 [Frankia sp. AiPs1]
MFTPYAGALPPFVAAHRSPGSSGTGCDGLTGFGDPAGAPATVVGASTVVVALAAGWAAGDVETGPATMVGSGLVPGMATVPGIAGAVEGPAWGTGPGLPVTVGREVGAEAAVWAGAPVIVPLSAALSVVGCAAGDDGTAGSEVAGSAVAELGVAADAGTSGVLGVAGPRRANGIHRDVPVLAFFVRAWSCTVPEKCDGSRNRRESRPSRVECATPRPP